MRFDITRNCRWEQKERKMEKKLNQINNIHVKKLLKLLLSVYDFFHDRLTIVRVSLPTDALIITEDDTDFYEVMNYLKENNEHPKVVYKDADFCIIQRNP